MNAQTASDAVLAFSATSDDIWWMAGSCLTAFAIGYGVGRQLQLAADISRAGS